MTDQKTQAERFKEVLEQAGIYASADFAAQALKHRKLASLHHQWTKKQENEMAKAITDAATVGVGMTWGGYFANGEPVLKRISPSSVFNSKLDDEA